MAGNARRAGVAFTPYLRDALDARPGEFARSTCFVAGHLTQRNAGWRSVRPVIDDARCTRCLSCYMYCPDGVVFKVRDDAGEVCALAIDYDFCKGCGVCAKVCSAGCIAMVDEHAGEGGDAPSADESTCDAVATDGPIGKGERA